MSVHSAFESLGDNCEYGFVQRKHGCEESSLLRWGISHPETLLNGIESNFEGLYQFENLVPHNNKMVNDIHTGFKFHTKMQSNNGIFLHDYEERFLIHKEELEKIKHLRKKFINNIKNPRKHYIYKKNAGLDFRFCSKLAETISSKGPGCVLVVHLSDADHASGSVMKVEDNLYFGYIDSFAGYGTSDQFDLGQWDNLAVNALKCMPQLLNY